jgi:Ser/Thr protein kinase RdoA (MazF antagonist)
VGPDASPIEAAVALGAAHGVVSVEPRVLKDGSNLVVHLQPAPVVVRIATFTGRVRRDPWPYLVREVALTTALVDAGAAVAPPSPLIAPGPHRRGDWAMTAWAFVDHVPAVVPDDRAALVALDALHEALRRVAIDLPVLGPATTDLDLAIDFGVGQLLLTAEGAAALRVRRDALVDELLALAPDRQALHGDAFPRNSLVTPSGIVWIDLEDCCEGPVAWDHAVLIWNTEDPGVERTLRERDGTAAIDAAMALREIQAGVWRLLHDARRDGRLDGPP